MTRLEMVETLRDKAGVTYDQARDALEKNDWDLLDALMDLKGDKTRQKTSAESKSVDYKPEIIVEPEHKNGNFASNAADKIGTAVKFVLSLISKGDKLRVEILYKEEVLGSVSVTVLALLLICCWYVPAILFVLGLLAGYRFRFSNKNAAGRVLNHLGDKLKHEAEEEEIILGAKSDKE